MTRVLHVVDRTTGGVPVAAGAYITNSPDGVEHHVISPFDDTTAAPVWEGIRAEMHDLGRGTTQRIARIRRVARAIDADVIHAHSSFAGAYARLATSTHRRRIVYTPHCYAFERKDISTAARTAYRAVEWALARNTSLVAACSPGEAAAARRLGIRADRTLYVPNVALLAHVATRSHESTAPLVVGTLGRISAQKDPEHFAAQIQQLRDFTAVEAWWIGDGDMPLADALAHADVGITGWLDPEQAAEKMDGLDVYLHSAAWEGFPLAILDAHARRLPILVRAISAFHGIDARLTIEAGMRDLVAAVAEDSFSQWAQANVARWADYLAANTPVCQRTALAQAWLATPKGRSNTETRGDQQ